ncbi:MAG TPA: AAA family ATPase [Verrucomicrobiales bacterium]|jgi:predicted ATPase|nr:AAA family ATPase [Verrucomicrobiales bacterium]
MLTFVHIENFRSFVSAETKLRPFTLVLGANGSGKSNFLKFFQMTSKPGQIGYDDWTTHMAHKTGDQWARFEFSTGSVVTTLIKGKGPAGFKPHWGNANLQIYNPSPDAISKPERPVRNPAVNGDGSGTCQVLDALKTGDREDLFNKIEEAFRTYVPEVEKLSLLTLADTKQIQVRERGLSKPLPATELSEGTRIILCLLTILHQENPPPIILLEDIDRGLHPRLFEYMAPLIRRIAEDHDINVIATTHNPYLVNYFRDDKEAVVLVEKENGESKLIPLTDRINDLHDSNGDVEEMPLGDLWFSGLLGGVPKSINLRARAGA